MRSYYLFTFLLQGVAAVVWECSNITENGVYYLPGFQWTGWTNVFSARGDLASSGRSFSYVYPIPQDIGCIGTVTVVEFCYTITDNRIRNVPAGVYLVFYLSTLIQNGSNFTVKNSISINSQPDRSKCFGSWWYPPYYCCDQVTLHTADQFHLPAQNFAFGATVPSSLSSPFNLQRFETLYRLVHFQRATSLLKGMTYNFGDNFKDELRALRFHLKPSRSLTTISTISETELNQESQNSTISETEFNQESQKNIGEIVGPVLAVFLILLLIVIILLLVWYILRQKKHHQPNLSMNTCYQINKDGNQVNENQVYDYADAGPPTIIRSFLEVKRQISEQKQEYEYDYVSPADNINGLYAQLEDLLSDHIAREEVRLGKRLGSGQFGEVYSGKLTKINNSVEVAVKTLKEGSSEEDKVKFLQEAAIMGQFKHPNVITMYGVVTDREPILLVLEVLQNGDLRNFILSLRTKNGICPEIDGHELLSYCRQVASGMVYLSGKAFVHRDLAARNILVSSDKICKISDFGMSRNLADEDYYISHGGMIPVKWTAPEALQYKKYSTASDVWSFGVVMYEIWSLGHKPFEGVSNDEVLSLISNGYRLPPPPGCPRDIYSVMISCWNHKKEDRPEFSEVSTKLSLSNSKLLHWSLEDKAEFPEATELGASLTSAEKLYEDLQITYK